MDIEELTPGRGRSPKQIRIEPYYLEENKWQTKTKVTASDAIGCHRLLDENFQRNF